MGNDFFCSLFHTKITGSGILYPDHYQMNAMHDFDVLIFYHCMAADSGRCFHPSLATEG